MREIAREYINAQFDELTSRIRRNERDDIFSKGSRLIYVMWDTILEIRVRYQITPWMRLQDQEW